jgi:hypothetical protein
MSNGKVFVDQYTLGSTPLTIGYLRTPGIQNVNLSVIKRFTVRERMGFDLHVNATNALNHTNHQFNTNDNTNQVSAITTAGSTAGRNGNVNFGSYALSVLEPRQITLQANFTF